MMPTAKRQKTAKHNMLEALLFKMKTISLDDCINVTEENQIFQSFGIVPDASKTKEHWYLLLGTALETTDHVQAAKCFIVASLTGNAFALLKLAQIFGTWQEFLADRDLALELRQFVVKECTYDLRIE
jgi:hypothetical protein